MSRSLSPVVLGQNPHPPTSGDQRDPPVLHPFPAARSNRSPWVQSLSFEESKNAIILVRSILPSLGPWATAATLSPARDRSAGVRARRTAGGRGVLGARPRARPSAARPARLGGGRGRGRAGAGSRRGPGRGAGRATAQSREGHGHRKSRRRQRSRESGERKRRRRQGQAALGPGSGRRTRELAPWPAAELG